MKTNKKQSEESWEERFHTIWNEDRFKDIGFVYDDFQFIKQFITQELSLAREQWVTEMREKVVNLPKVYHGLASESPTPRYIKFDDILTFLEL